ncbi:MAG: regulatory protein GntR [Candidatus Saccharibacteria bacterium]|nr:regulatory protein GntR [Candidatus Saccharibacteria bacterium]
MDEERTYYGFSDKWTYEVEEFNFTQIPNLLLSCQGHMGLSDGEILTFIHLLTFWFSNESKVFPSITTLTRFSNKGYSTIQARLKKLEDKGFIKRIHQDGTSNRYNLSPGVHILNEHIRYCPRPPRKRARSELKTSRVPSSYPINKEDEALRTSNLNNTWNIERNDYFNFPFNLQNRYKSSNTGPDKSEQPGYNHIGNSYE